MVSILSLYKQAISLYKKNLKLFRCIKYFLGTGIYFYDKEAKAFYSNKAISELKFEKDYIFFSRINNSHKKRVAAGLRKIFCGGGFVNLHSPNLNPSFCGKIAIISSVNSSIKVFDYTNNLILTFFKNSDLKKKISNSKEQFKIMGFNVIDTLEINSADPIIKQSIASNCLVERLVKKEPFDHKKAFEDLLIKTSNYHKFTGITSKLEIELADFLHFLTVNKIDCTQFNANYRIVIPKRMCHGDAHSLNIIFSNGTFYLIDFEMANYHSFFFDIMFYIFVESYRFDNNDLLFAYKNGYYDEQLQRLFAENESKFDPKLKPLYFLIVLYEYYFLFYKVIKIDNKIIKLFSEVFIVPITSFR